MYPNTFWLPGTGMQRGSLYLGTGDPETPGRPSIPNILRATEEEIAVRIFECRLSQILEISMHLKKKIPG